MRRILIVVLSVLFLFATCAFADSVTVNNPSFEQLPDGGLPNDCLSARGCYASAPIPGWTNSGSSSGQWQPNTPYSFFSLPFGPTVGWTNAETITQTVSVLPNTFYTLSVEVGLRADYNNGNAGQVALVVGPNVLYALGATPLSGGWSDYILTFNSGDNTSVMIELLKGSALQGDFDNVIVTPTPEPSSLILLGTGLIGFAGAIRRKLAR